MKYSKSEMLNLHNEVLSFDENITFEKDVFKKNYHLRGLANVNVSGQIHYDTHSDFVTCDLHITGDMILPCAITNEDVVYPFELDSNEVFAFHKIEDDGDIHEAKGDVIELMPIVFQNIMMEVPLKVVKPDLKEYPKGNGWEVINESDYQASKKNEVDPRLAKLKEFKIEEE